MSNFLLRQTIQELLALSSLRNSSYIYSFKLDLPEELSIFGKKASFQQILLSLLARARKNYREESTNKIILLTCKLENEQELSLSVTSGGHGLSLFARHRALILREDQSGQEIYEINHRLKKDFAGHLKIISKKNMGLTLKCYFPLRA